MRDNKISNKRLEPAPGVLYIVGTPIGNINDLSPRARFVLKEVSLIACEDTRHSGQLLKRLGIKTPLISFHRHNTKSRISEILQMLKQENSVAVISDAGLPLISDPGEELVSATRDENHEVICIPGPCAATTALVCSGLPCKRFCFEGFLPKKGKDRKNVIQTLSQEERTTVIYESPHKLIQLLEELAISCGENRPLYVARELTKHYEEITGANIGSVIQHFRKNKPQGEFTILLGGNSEKKSHKQTPEELRGEMKDLIKDGISPRDVARVISDKTGLSKRDLYSIIHKDIQNE